MYRGIAGQEAVTVTADRVESRFYRVLSGFVRA